MLRGVFLLLMLFIGSQLVALAQNNPPLVININGQIYLWTIGATTPSPSGCDLAGNRLHNWDPSLVLSPNSQWISFMVLEEDAMPTAPADTGVPWICRLDTGETSPLSTIRETRMVSNAVFSPDGDQIAWIEVADDPSFPTQARLMLRDLGLHETRVLIEGLPLTVYCSVNSGAPPLNWGEIGIVIPYALPESEDPCGQISEIGFALYSADGKLLNRFPVQNTNFDTFLWLKDEPRLAYYGYTEAGSETQLYTINMTTGEIRAEDTVIEAYMPSEGSGTFHVTTADWGYSSTMIYPPAGASALQITADVALSPDGDLMAFVLGHSLYFAEKGQVYPAAWNADFYEPYTLVLSESGFDPYEHALKGQVEIAWMNPSYRLVPISASVCPNIAEQDLSFGAVVIEGLGANRLRAVPYPNATIVGNIAEGSIVNIFPNTSPYVEQPTFVCSGGIRWQEVIAGNLVGWTAEAEGDKYYIGDGGG